MFFCQLASLGARLGEHLRSNTQVRHEALQQILNLPTEQHIMVSTSPSPALVLNYLHIYIPWFDTLCGCQYKRICSLLLDQRLHEEGGGLITPPKID